MNNAVFAIELDRRKIRVKEGSATSTDLLNAPSVLPESAVQRTAETKYTFDFIGNLVEELETRSGRGKTTITRVKTEFDNYTDNRWLIGLPRYHELEKQRTGEAAQKRVTSFVHNSQTGLLESVTAEPSGGNDLYYRQVLVRGERGVVERVEESAVGQAPRTTRFQYDGAGIHVRRIENAEGHVSWVGIHPALDVPMVSVDPNGVVTSQRYDGFGRLRFTDEPHSGDTSIEYGASALASDYGAETQIPAVTFTREQRAGGNDRLTAYDTLGRVLDSYFRAVDGSIARVSVEHDILGRERRRSLVHANDDGAPPRYSFSYDLLDRPTRTTNPDLSSVIRSYPQFFESRVQDETGRQSYVVTDVDGLVEKRVTINGGRSLQTTYTYWPFGNIHTVRDPRNALITTDYDVRGRRTKLIDPDAGVRKYFYTGFGDVREEWHGAKPTDNENFLYKDVYSYDRLGRLLTKTNTCTNTSLCRSDGIRRFDWDSRPKGVGNLGTVSAVNDAATIVFSYDNLGRPIGEATTINGALFTTDTSYDEFGRIGRIGYPITPGSSSRFEVNQTYTAHGYPSQVSDATRLYWQAVTRDLDGAVTTEQQGLISADARLLRKYDYDPLTRRLRTLDSVRSTSSSASVFQRHDYEFYANGQVQRRKEYPEFDVAGPVPSPRVTDEYVYDGANRLMRWARTGTGARAEEYDYLDDGNPSEIRYYGPAGALSSREPYAYSGANGAGPHAATSLGPNTYTYDKSGRQVERRLNAQLDSRRSYTSFDLPYLVQRGTTFTSFRYDAFERRAQKESPTEQVTYVGDLYERRVRKGANGTVLGTSHVFYIKAEGRVVAQVTRDQATGVEEPLFVSEDPLQTAQLLVNAAGFVFQRLYYAPWGQRLTSTGTTLDTNPAQPFRLGYTGHEHDDDLGLINMQGRLYDGRLHRFLSPDPIAEVPVRYPLGCLITPCDTEEASPELGEYAVSYTRLGGDESSFEAGGVSDVRSAGGSFGRGARGTDGMGIGLPDLALLTSRARVAPASEPMAVPLGHSDALNRYAYALNNPIQYRDPNGYWVETAWDIGSLVTGVQSFIENVRAGDTKAAIIDAVGVVLDAAAVLGPAIPGGVGAAIKAGRAAEQATDTARIAKSAGTTTKNADQAAETAAKAANRTRSLRSEAEFKAQYAEAGKQANQAANERAARQQGTTASGQATDAKGQKLGPSGKPAHHHVQYKNQHQAKRGAQDDSAKGAKATTHATPLKGGPHAHSTKKREGQDVKKDDQTHHDW